MNWIDGSTEFKCDKRCSASFPDTAEITSSTYRFQKKGLTGEAAKALCSTSSLQTSCGSFGKSPLPSEILLSTQKSASPVQRTTSGKKLLYSDGVIVCSEGAPAPKPVFSPEFCPFPHYLLRLGILNPSLLQAHAWPALLRGRDLVGICQLLAYLLPIIYQLVEEREIYADLPKFSSGVSLLGGGGVVW